MPSAWWRVTFCNRPEQTLLRAYTGKRGVSNGLLSHCLPFPDLRPADGLRSGAGGHYGPHPPLAKDDFRGGVQPSVKVSERNLAPALLILGRVGLTPKRIYIMSSDGSYKEVLL